jgi:hypothetical protein
MTAIATLIDRVRQDLHDEDSSAYRWTNAHLQRHLERAIREYSLASPRQRKSTMATTPGSREISLAAMTDLIRVEAIEWPSGSFPAEFVQFAVWDTTLTLETEALPAGENATIYWVSLHAMDGSTFPARDDELICRGAAGFAAQEQAGYSVNRITITGDATAEQFRRIGDQAVADFRAGLDRLRRTLRAKRLFV